MRVASASAPLLAQVPPQPGVEGQRQRRSSASAPPRSASRCVTLCGPLLRISTQVDRQRDDARRPRTRPTARGYRSFPCAALRSRAAAGASRAGAGIGSDLRRRRAKVSLAGPMWTCLPDRRPCGARDDDRRQRELLPFCGRVCIPGWPSNGAPGPTGAIESRMNTPPCRSSG